VVIIINAVIKERDEWNTYPAFKEFNKQIRGICLKKKRKIVSILIELILVISVASYIIDRSYLLYTIPFLLVIIIIS
jgi:hypothetical protein